jgi:predicted secreted protein
MPRIERIPAAFVWVILCISAIHLLADNRGIASTRRQELIVTEADSGNQVALVIGDQLSVRLNAQLGTGYSWQVVPDSTKLLALEDNSVAGSATTPGGQDIQILRFKAQAAGSGHLSLDYRQPWQKDVPAAKQFVLTVSVAER